MQNGKRGRIDGTTEKKEKYGKKKRRAGYRNPVGNGRHLNLESREKSRGTDQEWEKKELEERSGKKKGGKKGPVVARFQLGEPAGSASKDHQIRTEGKKEEARGKALCAKGTRSEKAPKIHSNPN